MDPAAAAPQLVSELVAELVSDRPRTPRQWEELFAGSWPPYVDADPVAAAALPAVRDAFPHLAVALTQPAAGHHDGDGDGEQLAGAAWGVPVAWDQDPAHLPTGYSDALVRSLADRESGAACDTLVVCAAQVHPAHARTGAAARLLTHLIDVGSGTGLHQVVAPLRLTGEHHHPTVPVEDYVTWRRPDGQALDPWLRTHERMGARVVTTAPASQSFVGTVGQWRAWTGLPLATSGQHLVPGALAPLHVDVEGDVGRLDEPGVWVRHR